MLSWAGFPNTPCLFLFFLRRKHKDQIARGEKIMNQNLSLEMNKFHIINILETFDLMSLTSLKYIYVLL